MTELAELRELSDTIAKRTDELAHLREERKRLMFDAHSEGASLRAIGDAAGLTHEMVRRIVGVRGEWANLSEASEILELEAAEVMRRALSVGLRPSSPGARWRTADLEKLRNL